MAKPIKRKVMRHIPTSLLYQYREYDRENCPQNNWNPLTNKNLDNMVNNIAENGIQEPLILLIVDNRALLVDGDHRLYCAHKLNLETVPFEIQLFDLIPESNYKLYLEFEKIHKAKEISNELLKYLV